MELLGRTYNAIPTADGVWVDMQDCSQVSFIGVGASDTYTLQSSPTASGGANLAVIDHSYQNAAANGSAAWTLVPQAAAATVVVGSGVAATVIEVNDKMLPDGDRYVRVSSTGAGLVVAIAGDLDVQRKPAKLAPLGG